MNCGPGFRSRCRRLPQRRPRRVRWSVSLRVLSDPSGPSLWTSPPKSERYIQSNIDSWIATTQLCSVCCERHTGSSMPTTTYLLHRPEGGLRLLVHLPDVRILDGEDDEASWVFSQQRLLVHVGTIVTVWSFIFAQVLQTKRAMKSHMQKIHKTYTHTHIYI